MFALDRMNLEYIAESLKKPMNSIRTETFKYKTFYEGGDDAGPALGKDRSDSKDRRDRDDSRERRERRRERRDRDRDRGSRRGDRDRGKDSEDCFLDTLSVKKF